MAAKFRLKFNKYFLIVTNILTLTFLIAITLKENYHKRLLNKFKSVNETTDIKDNFVSNEELSKMNNSFQPTFIDYKKGMGNKEFKVLIIGNSIAYHSIAENIGWSHESGMAATILENDYVHELSTKISEKLPNERITMRVTNFSEFERNPNSLLQNKIDSFINFKPDIVIFQLGENVQNEEISLFQKKYIELINSFKKDKRCISICTTPFFPSLQKNIMLDSITINTNSFLVDLSRLTLLDNENYAINENNYQGDKSKWKVSGIGKHPGDIGMKNIAKQLFITINGLICQLQSK